MKSVRFSLLLIVIIYYVDGQIKIPVKSLTGTTKKPAQSIIKIPVKPVTVTTKKPASTIKIPIKPVIVTTKKPATSIIKIPIKPPTTKVETTTKFIMPREWARSIILPTPPPTELITTVRLLDNNFTVSPNNGIITKPPINKGNSLEITTEFVRKAVLPQTITKRSNIIAPTTEIAKSLNKTTQDTIVQPMVIPDTNNNKNATTMPKNNKKKNKNLQLNSRAEKERRAERVQIRKEEREEKRYNKLEKKRNGTNGKRETENTNRRRQY